MEFGILNYAVVQYENDICYCGHSNLVYGMVTHTCTICKRFHCGFTPFL